MSALRLVARRRGRSTLAAVGVAATLASLIVAVAVAERGRRDALGEIERMGATVLTVSAVESRSRGGRMRAAGVTKTLTLSDARDVERLVPGVELVVGEFRGVAPVKVGNLARQATIAGVEPAYADLREAPLRVGRFFDDEDDAEGRRAAVLGARLARDLFGGRAVIGEQIRIRGIPFMVIGLLADRGTGLDAFDEDEVVFIPLKTARRRVFQIDFVQRLFIRAGARADLDEITAAVNGVLQDRHPRVSADASAFRVEDQRRLVTLRRATIERLGMFESSVVGVLLAAGAAGVFALQLLSVRERRAEVGTRRALGATRGMIAAQFIIEAAAITVVGGALGALAGILTGAIAGIQIPERIVVLGFIGSTTAGIIASLEPAWRAARLAPAVAFRV